MVGMSQKISWKLKEFLFRNSSGNAVYTYHTMICLDNFSKGREAIQRYYIPLFFTMIKYDRKNEV